MCEPARPLEHNAQSGVDFYAGEVLAFDKPLHWTSFSLVGKVRWLLTQRLGGKIKVGHAGTLDPLATGVVVLCTGRATKRVEELQQGVKEYVATLQLGATTPSYDLEHPVDHTYPTGHITRELVEEVLPRFIGEIMQVPPAFSACKVEGRRAYDMARHGEQPELRAKPLRIDEIEILRFSPQSMQLTLRIVCSKGTYIRALARDLGQALDSGAHLIELRRTRVGQYSVQTAFQSVDQFQQWLSTVPIAPRTAGQP